MKNTLSAFRFAREIKLQSMVEAGRSEMEIRTFLGGIGRGELRTNFPAVWHALQARTTEPQQ